MKHLFWQLLLGSLVVADNQIGHVQIDLETTEGNLFYYGYLFLGEMKI